MKIESTADALKYCYELSVDSSSYRYRGQAHINWFLSPTIYRVFNFLRYQTVEFEKNTLLAKPTPANPPLTHTTYDLEWLMLCQHYDIPTRLLDWSSDILTALFFACYDPKERNADGALFVCDHQSYPQFSAYSASAVETQKLAFINTNVVNPRMRTQSGCFMIWGHAPLDDSTTESYDLWEYHQKLTNDEFLEKICIPQYSKDKILKELEEIYSITYENLYLSSSYLENRYGPLFSKLKENARLMTLYKTDADSLSDTEEKQARKLFRIDCRNMLGSCLSLRK